MKTFPFKYILIIFLLMFSIGKSQVLLTTNNTLGIHPHSSAILEISDNNKGLLLPRVPLTKNTDDITVPTPVNGLLVFNSTSAKINYWEDSQWNRNFEINDALPYIESVSRFTSNSGSKIMVSGFPASTTLFNLEEGTSGWTDLNVNLTITATKSTNSVFLSGEGMAQLNNESYANNYQFAIGLFVDGKLKVVRKFKYDESNTSCSWKKFDVSGIFFNLPVGSAHQVKLYAKNLTATNTGTGYGTGITYGGSAGSCTNINDDIGRIFLTAQITE